MKGKVEAILRLSYPKMLLNLTAVFSFPVFALLLLVGRPLANSGNCTTVDRGRVVVYVNAIFVNCTQCKATESAQPGGTGSVKDLVLECCSGSPNGSIATSGYSIQPGVCTLEEEQCKGVTPCEFSVTLTIQMACHAELWVDRPDMDPDDSGRITESMAFDLSLSVPCVNEQLGKQGEVALKVYRARCSPPPGGGGKGDQVGEYTAKVKCAQCN
jgi:hypothetical protein